MIAAIYVALTMLFAPLALGLSGSVFQKHCAFCRFLLGCSAWTGSRMPVVEYLCGAMMPDIIFWYAGCTFDWKRAGSYALRKTNGWYAFPPIVANA